MKRVQLTLLITLSLLLVACTSAPAEPGISIEEPWVRASMMQAEGEGMGENEMGDMAGMGDMGGGNSAAYMIIRNTGSEEDRVISVASDVAEFVEMHRSEMRDGVGSMVQVESIEVPAEGEAVLEPGGLHIMLINLNRGLLEGDEVTLELAFEKSGTQTVTAEVRAP